MINLDKLSKRVDQALEAETKDSLTKWLLNKRNMENNNDYEEIHLNKTTHTQDEITVEDSLEAFGFGRNGLGG